MKGISMTMRCRATHVCVCMCVTAVKPATLEQCGCRLMEKNDLFLMHVRGILLLFSPYYICISDSNVQPQTVIQR